MQERQNYLAPIIVYQIQVMESDFRTLLLTYMYTNLSEETKVLRNKIAFPHEKNQSNEKE